MLLPIFSSSMYSRMNLWVKIVFLILKESFIFMKKKKAQLSFLFSYHQYQWEINVNKFACLNLFLINGKYAISTQISKETSPC